jgi:hypothetical protein
MIEHMFDARVRDSAPFDARVVETWVEQLASSPGPDRDDARVEMLAALDRLTCAAAGLQAEITAALDTSVRAREAERGVRAERRGRGVGAEVALARRESHHRGKRHVGLARILVDEMPCTRQALRQGRIDEWKATILVRETACLSLEDRQTVDRQLAGDLDRLEKRGVRELEGAARALAGELDAAACVLRRRIAESERHVTLRPVPDTMTRLSAELPVATGVAVFKALSDAADSARAAGDSRSRGQVMADTLAERVLGTARAVVPVEVELVVSDEVLLGEREDSARLDGYGPIPAELARELVSGPSTTSWPRSDGSTATPRPASWWPWTPAAAASRAAWPASSGCATRPAALPGATPRSGTPITPSPSPPTARPRVTTERGFAKPATTPRKLPGGQRRSSTASDTRSRFGPPWVKSTVRPLRPFQATYPDPRPDEVRVIRPGPPGRRSG